MEENNTVTSFDYKNTPKVLQVKNLRVNFKSDSGLVYAVRGVSFDLYKGETLCIVGESGSGKSVTSKTIMGILANNAIIESGQILYEGEDLVRISEEEFHRIRGIKIGMIFQDPLSSLNPIVRVGKQITEATLINRNILKKHYFELISKQLVALRNMDANVFYEINKAKEEIAKIDSFLKAINSKKIDEEALEPIKNDIKEYVQVVKKSTEDEISSLNYRIETLEKETYDSNIYFDEEIKEAKLENRNLRLNLLKEFETKISTLDNNDILLARKEFLKELINLFKLEKKNLKPILKKALSARKKDASSENKTYAANLKAEHEAKITELTSKYEEAVKEVEYRVGGLNALELERYNKIVANNAPKKKFSIFGGGKQEEINISKLSKQEEVITSTGNEDFDKVYEEMLRLKKEIDEENDRYINSTKITRAEAKKMAINVMKEVGIPLPEKRFRQYPFEFSGGMRQRIVIAIALTANPDILICDEPTTALDVTIQAQILELINRLKRERGLSCIFITHDLGVVANMADRVAVMYAGKIVEYGTSYEVFYNPKHPYTWALLSSIPDVDSKEKLDAIPGTPPDMRFPPKGDAFALRSKYALDIDFLYEPPFFKISDTHYAATWLLHEDAPKVEMPSIVKTRIANSLKTYEENNEGAKELLKAVVPEESFEYIKSIESESFKQALFNKNEKAYQNYVDGNANVDKETTNSLDDDEFSNVNELEGVKGEDVKQELANIKSKCKFKQEYVDNKIILSVNHLKQYFFFGKGPNRYKLKAVHDVNFQIKEGECFGIVGESGCGKTTTGRSIIRLYHITSGSIYYKGYRIGAGTRWNDKEIKYTKIRLKEQLKSLKSEFDSGVFANEEEYKAKVEEAKAKANDIIKVQKAKIAQIKHDDKKAPKLRVNDVKISQLENDINVLKETLKHNIDEINNDVNLSSEEKTNKVNALHQKFDERIERASTLIESLKANNHRLMSEIQMIFQDPIDSLDPRMTVEDIIQEGLKIQGYTNKKENHEKVINILEKVGLIADYCNRYPHEFSGGQRQRIGIARTLIMNPKLLICDEPISALDVSIRAQIINLLNDLKEEMGLSIIFIAHDLSVVKYFCDRIAVMYFGEIVELATSDELFRHPLHPYTKSLLSAIPKPNPLSEKNRQRIPYNPREVHDYSVDKPKFVEIEPGHFILANTQEVEKYKLEMAKIDREAELEAHDNETSINEPFNKEVSNDEEVEEIVKTFSEVEDIASKEEFIDDLEAQSLIGEESEKENHFINLNNEDEASIEDIQAEENESREENDESPLEDEVSKEAETQEEAKPKNTTAKVKKERNPDHKKVYHLKKVDGKWQIILKEGKKVIKTFDTKEEGLKYGKALAKSQDGTLLVHVSRGKNKGKFQKN